MADYKGLAILCSFSVILSLSILQFSFAQESSGVLDDCKRSCERRYPLHTYPKEEPVEACKQGCRLSAIEQLATSNYADRVNTTQSCLVGCQESYEEPANLNACQLGCQSQDIIPSPQFKVENMMPDEWSLRTYMIYLYPVIDVGKYCSSGFMNSVSYYYQMSSAYYYSYSDGESVLVEVNELPRAYIDVRNMDGDKIGYADVSYYQNEDHDSSYSTGVLHKGHRWLQCVSRRSGLPLWFLTATLFFSVLFLSWLCCATASTAPKEKAKPAVVGELLYLDEDSLLEKLPLVKTDEKDDAGPLPVKVHIDATTL